MPQLKRDAREEFAAAHLPGARFFDIDAIADQQTSLPHMLPAAAQFAEQVGALGIGTGDLVVVYDTRGVISAARVWWTFRAMGHDRVAVLDGGLPCGAPRVAPWRAPTARRGPALQGAAAPGARAHARADAGQSRGVARAGPRRALAGTLRGHGAGARAGLRGGHIPKSLNLPYDAMYRPDGTLLPREELRRRFESSGLDLERPVVTTCGSGVTASVARASACTPSARRPWPSTTARGASGAATPTRPWSNDGYLAGIRS